jgi:hypothetical protein
MKTCQKGLHQYSKDLKRCPDCTKLKNLKFRSENPENAGLATKKYRDANPEKAAKAIENWKFNNPEKAKEANQRACKNWRDTLKTEND